MSNKFTFPLKLLILEDQNELEFITVQKDGNARYMFVKSTTNLNKVIPISPGQVTKMINEKKATVIPSDIAQKIADVMVTGKSTLPKTPKNIPQNT